MPVLTDEHKALIGKETAPQPAPEAINIAMARHWCEMVEDANPIYFDDDTAKNSWLKDTFAPPTMLYTWRMAPVWPKRNVESTVLGLKIPGCDATLAVTAVQEYEQPLRYGDTLTVSSKIASISDEKTTRIGSGHFITTVDTFRNQNGDIVGTHSFTLFRYRPSGGDA
ncbi:MAG: MaoC family dehydratase N-terminal domain-containing protein [Chloroflexi bacterium]|nr:MaoC family dehydratase N-terminal domain-containing protein [Chloroflexota bacterium]